jgi:hypothetical protein
MPLWRPAFPGSFQEDSEVKTTIVAAPAVSLIPAAGLDQGPLGYERKFVITNEDERALLIWVPISTEV